MCLSLLGWSDQINELGNMTNLAPTAETVTYTAFSLADHPKYAANFTHFSYANPDAPKKGTFRVGRWGTEYTTMNPDLIRGTGAPGSGVMFESLMSTAEDDPFTLYPKLAKNIEVAKDGTYVIFNLNEKARWNHPGQTNCDKPQKDDRKPVTADDIAFSYKMLREKGQEGAGGKFNSVTSYEVLSDNRIVFHLKPGELKAGLMPLAQMRIYSKDYYLQPGHKFDQLTLDVPPGSGPYTVAPSKIGKLQLTYDRVCNYWGADLPTSKGLNNFDHMEFNFFGDRLGRDQAFENGQIDYKMEDRGNLWPKDLKDPTKDRNGYNSPKLAGDIRSGQVVLQEVDMAGGRPFSGVAFNSNIRPLADRDVRKALSLLYDRDYESTELKNGTVKPVTSYFPGTDFSKIPKDQIDKILQTEKNLHPKEFPDEALSPQKSESGDGESYADQRSRALQAKTLMERAGWRMQPDPANSDHRVWMKQGAKFPVLEWPSTNPNNDLIYVEQLKKFGMQVDLKQVAPEQSHQIREQGTFALTRQIVFHPDMPGPSCLRIGLLAVPMT